MVAVAPIVFETMGSVTPALGPESICTEYPANDLASVWFVMIVDVVPPVAVSDEAAMVVPVDHDPATPAAPPPNTPESVGLGNATQPSSLGLYNQAAVVLLIYNCCCLKCLDDAIKDPAPVAEGAGLTCSHRFKSNIFLFPFVVAIVRLRYVYVSAQIISGAAFQ
jgi:hypothetical protein